MPIIKELQPWEILLDTQVSGMDHGLFRFVADEREQHVIDGWYFQGGSLESAAGQRAELRVQARTCATAAVSSYLLTEDRRGDERIAALEARVLALELGDPDDEVHPALRRFGTFPTPLLVREMELVEVRVFGGSWGALRVVMFGTRMLWRTD